MTHNKIITITLVIVCVFIAVLWNKKTVSDDLQLTQLQSEQIPFVNEPEPVKVPSLPMATSSIVFNKTTIPIISSPAEVHGDVVKTQLEAAATEDALIKKAESFNQWLLESSQTSIDFNLSNEIKKRFEQEDIDVYWAAGQENFLQNLFIDSPALSGIALTDVKCRTTQCQLTIAISDIDQANQLVGQVNTALLQQGYENLMVIAVPEEKGSITRLYINNEQALFNTNL